MFDKTKINEKEARDQCDQIWRNYATLAKKSAIVTKFGGSFSIWHIVQQTLANFLWYWANLHCCKWPRIKNCLAIWTHWLEVVNSSLPMLFHKLWKVWPFYFNFGHLKSDLTGKIAYFDFKVVNYDCTEWSKVLALQASYIEI